MNNNWKTLPFGEVCELVGGSQPPKSEFIYEPREGYIRLVQVRDYKTDKYETYIPISKAKKFCSTTDIMIGRYGPPIFGIFSGIEGAYNVALMKAIPNESLLNRDYFRWFLKTHTLVRFVEKTSKRAAGQDGVRKERLYNYKVPIPPIEEQKKIVAILDEAFEAIDQAQDNIEKNIENAKELFQSKLNDIFSQKGEGWEEKKLIEVNRFIDYRGKTPKKTEFGIRLINAKIVRMGYMRNEPEEFIAEADYDEWMTRGIPRKGDVLFTTEAPLANVTLLDISEKIALAQRIITLCPNREVLSGEFLTFCLQSKLIQDEILEKGTGATVTGIKSKLLKEIKIPIPPNSSQEEIVQTLNQFRNYINELISTLQTKYDSLDELKKSLLEKAFAGELTHKDISA